MNRLTESAVSTAVALTLTAADDTTTAVARTTSKQWLLIILTLSATQVSTPLPVVEHFATNEEMLSLRTGASLTKIL